MQQVSSQTPSQIAMLTVTQVAQVLGLSRGKVYQLIREEHLPVVPFGRTMRIIPDSLHQWLAQREARAKGLR